MPRLYCGMIAYTMAMLSVALFFGALHSSAHADSRAPSLGLLHTFHHNTENEKSPQDQGRISAIFTKDGTKLICAINRRLFIWDIQKHRTVKTLLSNTVVNSMSISADSTYLATTEEMPHPDVNAEPPFRLRVWNFQTTAVVLERTHLEEEYKGVFAPSGHLLALPTARKTVSNPQFDLWLIDVSRSRVLRRLHSIDEMPPVDIAWSRDGKQIAATTFYGDAGVGTLSVWRTNTPEPIYRYDEDDASNGENIFTDLADGPLCFIGGGHKLISGQEWIDLNIRRPKPISVTRDLSDAYRCVCAFGWRADLVLLDRPKHPKVNDGQFTDPYQVWDLHRQRRLAKFRCPYGHEAIIAVSPNARMLVTARAYRFASGANADMHLYVVPSGGRRSSH